MVGPTKLEQYGGERAVHPSFQETTLVQHIFGGRLQSQVICTKCNNVSNQFENMMDLTVEMQGDAASLEECLDQFTAKEWLDGDNKYKCDGCVETGQFWHGSKRANLGWVDRSTLLSCLQVDAVELDEGLSQGAYMLLYSRVTARQSCLNPIEETSRNENLKTSNLSQPIVSQPVESSLAAELVDITKKFDTMMHANDLTNNISTSQNPPDSTVDLRTADLNPNSSV